MHETIETTESLWPRAHGFVPWLNFGRWVRNRDRWHEDMRVYLFGHWTPLVLVRPRFDRQWS